MRGPSGANCFSASAFGRGTNAETVVGKNNAGYLCDSQIYHFESRATIPDLLHG
jgi:hypothetical protein